jgi:hypothetical protein
MKEEAANKSRALLIPANLTADKATEACEHRQDLLAFMAIK